MKIIISEKIPKINFFSNIYYDISLLSKFYRRIWDLALEKFVKKSWKFFSNPFIVLSLEFELFFALFPLTFTFSAHRLCGLCFPVKTHEMNVKIV